jgi:hypothetical protein
MTTLLASLVFALALSGDARAQASPGSSGSTSSTSTGSKAAPSATDKESARDQMDRGDKEFAAGNFKKALEHYQAADKIMGVPTTGWEVGRTQEKLGLLVEARDTLLRVSRYPQKPGEPKPFTKARNKAIALAGAIKPRVPTLVIEVKGVAVDTVVSVFVAGKQLANYTVGAASRINSGKQPVRCVAPGYEPSEQFVQLAEGQSGSVTCEMVEAPTEISPLVWVGFGVGAAGLLVGTITGIVSLTKVSELDDVCPDKQCPPEHESLIDEMNTMANVSNVGFIVGGVGVAVGVVALIVGLSSDPSDSGVEADAVVKLQPFFGPGVAGVRGTF